MNKKKLLISGGILLVILIICVIVFIFIKNKNVKETVKEAQFDIKVASTITMDINPSIKVEVNKDSKVIIVIDLNEDAKSINSDDLKERNVNDVIKTLTTRLLTVGCFKDDATIIINVAGDISSDNIKNVIKNTLKNSVEVNIIEPVITEGGKKLAKDLGITEAKASYLEEVISENPNIKIEDIKDKSVKEIEEVTNENTDKNEDATNNTTTNNNKPSGGNLLQKCEKKLKP